MVSIEKSDYGDTIHQINRKIKLHHEDILVSNYTAQSASTSTWKFRVQSNGPRSLMYSEALLSARISLDVKTNSGGDLAVTNARARNSAKSCDAFTSQADIFAVNTGDVDDGDDVPEPLDTLINAGFAPRFSGFWEAVQSINIEVNGSASVSVIPEQYVWVFDECYAQQDEGWPQGPPDSNCGPRRLGRAHLVGGGVDGAPIFELYEVDKGLAKRCQKFQESIVSVTASHQFEYQMVVRIPCMPFSYWRNSYGSGKAGWIPYVSRLAVTMNFKPNAIAFREMFCCSGIGYRNNVGAQLTSGGTVALGYNGNYHDADTCVCGLEASPGVWGVVGKPQLQLLWAQPKNMNFAPSYSFSVPNAVMHRQSSDLGGKAAFSSALENCE